MGYRFSSSVLAAERPAPLPWPPVGLTLLSLERTDPWPEERKRRSVENTLLKRMVEADEIASAMLFLSVHTAINAQTIVIDCGREN